jgi:hypothetical protein
LYRDESNTESRAINLKHTIDPGFVNRRLVQTIIGDASMKFVDQLIGQIPSMPDRLYEVRINHAYCQVLLGFCEALNVKTLGELLASGNGHLFCSTEELLPCPNVYDAVRVESIISPPGNSEYSVVLEYSTEHVLSTTLREELERGAILSVVAKFRHKREDTLYFHPLVMGGPWMSHEDEQIAAWGMLENFNHFENFIEDFDEFSKVRNFDKPTNIEPMRHISEVAFKTCLARLLGDPVKKDWGGEMSDHFTSQLHLAGRRVTGAFLLKGPSRFRPMTLNHLGKNNDQIFRLSQQPADVFFVQHCHEIEAAVRATLRAFAVQPGRPRRYCLIDGRDSLWLLQSYGLYEDAIKLSGMIG